MPKTYNPQKDVFKIIGGKKQPVEPYDLNGKKEKAPKLESLYFDGKLLTATATDANGHIKRLSVPADAGSPLADGSFDYSPQRQKQPNHGPLPEGSYIINPQSIQRPSVMDTLIGIVGKNPIKTFGKYPGSLPAWGRCRIPINKTEEQAKKTDRDGFTIHGGWKRGSAGCIDLMHNEEKFCQFIEEHRGTGQNSVPLTVDYSEVNRKHRQLPPKKNKTNNR